MTNANFPSYAQMQEYRKNALAEALRLDQKLTGDQRDAMKDKTFSRKLNRFPADLTTERIIKNIEIMKAL